ncbi:DUF6177 family protein [Nocardiopsis lucentensis]|uniref:DUF6177 family protein n=1 Tax=Nocardiopsis lucentensis TaxID=53441 RepID=UPI00036C0935|nr:DUF6177 family protein [Nocardiopsis lucentensis]
MSYDVVALVAQEPDAPALTRVLTDLAPTLLLGRYQETGVLQVRDTDGRLLVTVEPGQRVEARDEVRRLLGDEVTTGLPDPCWWVELRACPDASGRETAHRIADALALRLGGIVWTSPETGMASDADLWEETAHPTVERTARHAVVVAQDREVVGFSSWLNDAVGVHGAQRAIQVLTPATSRLTYALRAFLAGPLGRWVVRGEDGTRFDGLTGLALRWDDAYGFVPERADLDGLEKDLRDARERGEHASAPRPATGSTEESAEPEAVPGFLSTDPMQTQLIIELSVLHRDASAARVGRAVEILTERLTGAAPAGWGPHEPALAAWDRERIARFVRDRSRRRTLVHLNGPHGVGHPFTGSLRVERRGDRVGEQASLAIGFTEEDDVPFGALPDLVESLAAERLLEGLQVRRVRGRGDLTYEPRWAGLAVPIGLAIGPERVEGIGLRRARSGPIRGTVLGADSRKSLWFPVLGTAESPARAVNLVHTQLRHLAAAGQV